MDLHFFDPNTTAAIVERRLPHWSQAGVICFITLRTHDSMPADVINRWRVQRMDWLRQHGINPQAENWRERLTTLEQSTQADFHATFSKRWHDELDRGHGDCVLRRPDCAAIIAESFRKFDGERYMLSDFVVMPNHAHLLVAFKDDDSMLRQCEAWKRFSARVINKLTGGSGRFWQQDGFDHLVRSPEQFAYLQRYIAENPEKARLKPGEYIHYSESVAKSATE